MLSFCTKVRHKKAPHKRDALSEVPLFASLKKGLPISVPQRRYYSSFGFPVSTADASSNPCLIWSYSASTGRHPPPAGFAVSSAERCITLRTFLYGLSFTAVVVGRTSDQNLSPFLSLLFAGSHITASVTVCCESSGWVSNHLYIIIYVDVV